MIWKHSVVRLSVVAMLFACGPDAVRADDAALEAQVRKGAAAVEEKVIKWREDIRAHPELADQKVRTSRRVADHLRSLGLELRTGVARHGVVAVLKGSNCRAARGHGCLTG